MQEKQKKWMLRIALYLVGIIVLAQIGRASCRERV